MLTQLRLPGYSATSISLAFIGGHWTCFAQGVDHRTTKEVKSQCLRRCSLVKMGPMTPQNIQADVSPKTRSAGAKMEPGAVVW
ncbi:hypothetical protein GDO81_007112 [Engystomops pustulosus]|uniref:Secreted protein n=1 Tax=Engystomops pustulosus TaxID=76066 RepID=A0AAV7C506_ENGPU|nr:hypothetical protein GDO81_007112 [Engystomops pustulosus]